MVKKSVYLRSTAFACIAFLVLSLHSCLKDIKDIDPTKSEWRPGIAVPVLDGSLSFENIIASSDTTYLRKNPDNSLYLIYRNTLPSRTAESVFSIPAQDYNSSFSMDAATILAYHAVGSYAPPTLVDTIPFSLPSNQSVDHIEFKGGSLVFNLKSDFTDSVQFTVSIAALKKNNVAFTDTFKLNYSNGKTLPISVLSNVNLNGYKLDLTEGGTTTNKFVAQVGISFKYLGGTTSTTDKLQYDISFSNVKYSYIDGYVGQLPFSLPSDSISFNIFNNAYAGSIQLTDPQIKVYVTNSFGIPIKVDFNKFDAEFADGSKQSIGTVSKVLPYPLLRTDPPVTDTTVNFNKSNSNIVTVLSQKPRKFIYGASAMANPNGKTANFIKDTSSFRIALETKIPLELTINGLTVQDTFPGFTLPQDVANKLEYLQFKLNTTNGFPVDVGLQLYFTDSLYNRMDSLITPYQEVLNSATVPAGGGRAVPSAPRILYFTIDKPRVTKLTTVKHILVKGVMKSFNQGTVPVKFYSDYKLGIKLGVVAKVNPQAK